MRLFSTLGAFLLLLIALLSCEAPRDSYKLTIAFTSDVKGYLEDCG